MLLYFRLVFSIIQKSFDGKQKENNVEREIHCVSGLITGRVVL